MQCAELWLAAHGLLQFQQGPQRSTAAGSSVSCRGRETTAVPFTQHQEADRQCSLRGEAGAFYQPEAQLFQLGVVVTVSQGIHLGSWLHNKNSKTSVRNGRNVVTVLS